MEQLKMGNEIPKQNGAKVNIPVKCAASELDRLKKEASNKGMGVSPYVENVLLKHNDVVQQRDKAKTDLAEANRKIATLESGSTNEKIRHQNDVAELKGKISMLETAAVKQSSIHTNEIEELKKQISTRNNQQSILSDKRLLWLFEQVKGTTKTVQSPYGETISITFN